jgi:hypothetical protein
MRARRCTGAPTFSVSWCLVARRAFTASARVNSRDAPGVPSRKRANSAAVTARAATGVPAVTVAERGPPSMTANSPARSPAASTSISTERPSPTDAVTLAAPLRITYAPRDWSPSRIRTAPGANFL